MITPVEVLGKELRRGFGYKAVEVDEFLEELAKDYEKVYTENNELRKRHPKRQLRMQTIKHRH